MRAFPVRLPSGARYWTVLDDDLAVAPVVDGFLRQARFGRDGADSTAKSYAHPIALSLRWCARTGRTWQAGAGQLPLFMAGCSSTNATRTFAVVVPRALCTERPRTSPFCARADDIRLTTSVRLVSSAAC
jgi:integrase/recombinase XerD